ncbi:hypothetical protein AURDEDRAFT_76175 [Auricularia subglabra TFB-10046 SS5]|nr:hypothetical protein AURDEDRAFT_76175 [Auricularia subglabra TFB-10046 SS5]
MPTLAQSVASLKRHGTINALLVFLPLAWIAHFLRDAHGENKWPPGWRFALNLLAIVPLQERFEWIGEEMVPYLGAELGELLMITLSNTVEASLAIGLLIHDNYRLLQITVVGVVLLHILLVPGVAFFTGGANIIKQELHSGKTQINHTLLTLGVMAVAVPAAFFAALDRGSLQTLTEYTTHLNVLSRGIAILLLLSYVGARIYIHNPPGKRIYSDEDKMPSRLRERALEKESRDSKVGPWFGVYAIVQCVGLMVVTAQFLVSAAETLVEESVMSEHWFGLILLPLVSFTGDAILSVAHWVRRGVSAKKRNIPVEPDGVASGISIDLSIQFLLFWLPLLVLVAWCAGKPLLVLFDLLEVALLAAACFLVNYVTADAKTNWAEGAVMVVFYVIVALVAWYYPGQVEVRIFNVAHQTVADAVANGVQAGHQ